MKKIIYIVFCILIISGCAAEPKQLKQEELADLRAYGDVIKSEQHHYRKSSFAEVFDILDNKKDGFFYIGYPDCPWCVEILPILEEVAKENDTFINYIELYDEKGEVKFNEEDRNQFIELMDAYLDANEDGEKTLYVPFVFYIENGEVKASHIATFDDHNAHERKMTSDEIAKMKQIYKKML